jgi:CheY-like chemotaxis protein
MQDESNTGAGSVDACTHNLLVIDDARIHRTLISRVAEQVGFATTTASTYEEAAKLLQGRKFDCITLDLGLGDHGGVEILQLLAKLRSDTPVMIISGADKNVSDEAVKVGKSLNVDIRGAFPKSSDVSGIRVQLDRIRLKSSMEKSVLRNAGTAASGR